MTPLPTPLILVSQLEEMRSVPESSLRVYTSEYGLIWWCVFDMTGASHKVRVEIRHTHKSLSMAVQLVYDDWRKLHAAVPGTRPALLDFSIADRIDDEHGPTYQQPPTAPFNDEIPF